MTEFEYFTVAPTVDSTIWQMSVQGEIDRTVAEDFQAALVALDKPEATTLVIDLSGVTYIDSTCLGVLIGALKHAEQTEKELRLRNNMKPAIKRMFEITGLDQLFTFEEPTEDQA